MSSNPSQTPAETHEAKRLARLAAVQALYETVYEQQSADEIVRTSIDQEFEGLTGDPKEDKAFEVAPEADLFAKIVRGTVNRLTEVDEVLAGSLSENLSAARLEKLLRAILRAGIFELMSHTKIPTGVIINDYVDVTRAFFNGREPGLVNAVLDKVGQKVRS